MFSQQLNEITVRSWSFADPRLHAYSIRQSRFTGDYEVCFRRSVGNAIWETRTLSSHASKAEAVSAVTGF